MHPAKVQINNEIGRLRKVIVHAPGPELLAVTPENRSEYLYDDIIDLEGAVEEHRRFSSILRRFTTVLEFRDLLEETLQIPEARQFLTTRSEEVTAHRTLGIELADCTTKVLTQRYIEGWKRRAGPFSEALEQKSYVLPPLPNLFFTRDSAVVVGHGAAISAMRFNTRWPEEVLARTIFGFHPDFAGVPIFYDGSDERRHDYSIEGGDIHPLSPDVVLVGISERSTPAALDELCDVLFKETAVSEVISVVLPANSTAIHLDMVWTQVDRELCAVHPPLFRGLQRAPVLYRRKGEQSVRQPDNLFEVLREVNLTMVPIYCGGSTRETQEREQWASGCNFFSVAPGQVIAYSRNEQTLRAMEDSGFRIVDSVELLLGDDSIVDNERAVIAFMGSELVRGGGGPRCMTCPVWREDI